MAFMKFIVPEVVETVTDSSVAVVDVVETTEAVVVSEAMMGDIEAVAVVVLEVEELLVAVDLKNRKLHYWG